MKKELITLLAILALAGCASSAEPDKSAQNSAEGSWLNDPDWDNDDGSGK